MFQNVGQKIKGLAKIIFTAGILLSVIIGIIFFTLLSDNSFLAFISAVVCVGFGILASWLSVLLLYGYGDLIDNTSDIRSKLCGPDKSASTSTSIQQINPPVVFRQHWVCKNCGRQNTAESTFCWNCKKTP